MKREFKKYDTSQRVAMVLRLLMDYSSESERYTRKAIADYFEDTFGEDQRPSEKTLSKDLTALMENDFIRHSSTKDSDDYGYQTPIPYKGAGYYPATKNLELWELKIIIDSLQEIQFFDEETLENIIDKIKSHIPDDMLDDLDEVENSDFVLYSRDKRFGENMDKLSYALCEKKAVSFDYQKRGEDKERIIENKDRRVLSPYEIHRVGTFFYVSGWKGTQKEGEPRTYRIDHIYNLKVHANSKTQKKVSPGEDLTPRQKGKLEKAKMDAEYIEFVNRRADYFKKRGSASKGGFLIGEPIKEDRILITLHNPEQVNTLYDVFGFHNVEKFGNDFSIKNATTPGIYLNLLSMGSAITVNYPPSVKEEMARRIAEMNKLYNSKKKG